MGRGPALRARDIDAIRDEMGPAFARLRQLAKLHGVTVGTIIKCTMLPEPINVLPVPVKGLSDWNDRIAGQ